MNKSLRIGSIVALGCCLLLTGIYLLYLSPPDPAKLGWRQQLLTNPSGAGKSLDQWFLERSYPSGQLPMQEYLRAFERHRLALGGPSAFRSGGLDGEWESLGPKNIAGRTLCLGFDPVDPDVIYAGSASGGLWKTTTQGVGEDAWEYVPTGFPLTAVGAIAVHPEDPDILFVGTGETYGVGIAEPGTVNRLTRGTYGFGILRTTDGGQSWEQVLDFQLNEIVGVQDIEISAQNDQEIYAATTNGLYQSLDGGDKLVPRIQ